MSSCKVPRFRTSLVDFNSCKSRTQVCGTSHISWYRGIHDSPQAPACARDHNAHHIHWVENIPCLRSMYITFHAPSPFDHAPQLLILWFMTGSFSQGEVAYHQCDLGRRTALDPGRIRVTLPNFRILFFCFWELRRLQANRQFSG
jgi:hypothetical protein